MPKLTRESRIAEFIELMHPYISDDFKSWLIENCFFDAPASTTYHGAYSGGLFDHCRMVAENLAQLTDDCHLEWQRKQSPYIVGMFHDLCKIDCYQHPIIGYNRYNHPIYDPEKWVHREETALKGHGDKSIMLLSMHTTLTEEELMCIRYHMGAFTDKEE